MWRDLDHIHILPFLGIDATSFPPYFCLVSPWMEHGTVLQYLEKEPGLPNCKIIEFVGDW
jgi:hypothetical protein